MKLFSIVSLLLLLRIFPVSGFGGIIEGKTSKESYPFFVFVEIGQKRRGGTLVAANAVLTAAHCLFLEQEYR